MFFIIFSSEPMLQDGEDQTDNVAPWRNLSNDIDIQTVDSRMITTTIGKERVIFVNRPNPTKFCNNSIR